MVNCNAGEKFVKEGLTFDDVLLIPACSDVLPADVDRESAVAAAKADARVQSFLAGKGVVKEIFVPGRIVNLVVK